jgi:transcriptional regulator with XRE-family HTH domain
LSVDLLYSILYPIIRRIASMDIVKVFGTNVKHYRQALGISQEAFAEKCGLHRTYISAIECYRRSISLENIQRIADALEIETYKLFLEE